MKRKLLLFVIPLCLLAVVLSISVPVFSEMMKSEKPVVSKKPAARDQKPEKIEARIKELDDKLDLTLEQKGKIKEILTGVRQETSKLVSEAAAKAKKLREKGDADIEAILTKEQRDIFNNVPKEEETPEDEMLKVFK